MLLLTLFEIKSEVEKLADKIGAAGLHLPSYGKQENDARPYVDVNSQGYHYIVMERGQEYEHIITTDLDTLLFSIFVPITFMLAMTYELAHRIETQDSRRITYQWQNQLLASLSPEWANRQAHHQAKLLQERPFDDYQLPRALLCRSYREQGLSGTSAWQMAYEKYPPQPREHDL